MITLLRSGRRRYARRGKQQIWHSLGPRGPSEPDSFVAENHPGPLTSGFGCLVAFEESRLPPGFSTGQHSDHEAEILTYVYKGALSQEDTAGHSGVIHAGEFQRMSTGRCIRHKETSVSRSDWVHMFRISLRPSELGIDRHHVQKRFTDAQRHNLLCVVASPDGRKGSLPIHQDALICSAIVDPGHHLVHELVTGRTAWVHVVSGAATLNDIVLTQGDGVGVTNERSVSLTVQESAELLLVDLGPAELRPWEKTSGGRILVPPGASSPPLSPAPNAAGVGAPPQNTRSSPSSSRLASGARCSPRAVHYLSRAVLAPNRGGD